MTVWIEWEADDFSDRPSERAEVGDYLLWVWPVEGSSQWTADGRFRSIDEPPTEIGVFSNKREAKKAAAEWLVAQEAEDEAIIDVEVERAFVAEPLEEDEE